MNEVATKRTDGLRSVQISQTVDEALEEYCRRHDKIKRKAVTRILARFLSQPPAVQRVFTGEDEQDMEPQYAAALESLATELRERWEKRHNVKSVGKRRGANGATALPPSAPSHEPEPDARKRQ